MKIELSQRILELPPYLFAHIDELRTEARRKGADLIDVSVGDPDLPTHAHIVEEHIRAAKEGKHHRYASYVGMMEFRQAAASYYQSRFGVTLDPAKEVVALIGSKEGIAHFPVAFCNPGDTVICPNPGYPVFESGTKFSSGKIYSVPLHRENGFLPDFKAIPADVCKAAKYMWVNYPNNPTAAVANKQFFTDLVEWALRNEIVICSDNAYCDIYYDEASKPCSILEVPGAKECAIEFYSLSKTYNMTGWRVAFAVGNPTLISGLGRVKTNVDSGIFEAIQMAGIAALTGSQACVAEQRAIYKERRDIFCGGLAKAGYDVLVPQATFFCMVANPKGVTSMDFVSRLLAEAHVVATPGTGFGSACEGFVRFALCTSKERLAEAVSRIQKMG